MGIISNIIKKDWGIEITPQQKQELTADKIEKQEKYFKKVFEQVQEQPTKQEITEKYTLEQLKNQFLTVANQQTGQFIINDQNKEIINTLFFYFIGAETQFLKAAATTVKNKPALNKGLLLIGNMGSGKTQIMQIFKALRWQKFSKCTVYDIVEAYNKGGENGLNIYFKGNRFIDELGAEKEGLHFGSREDVLTRILEKRYSSFKDENLKTYLTTNLSQKQIAERYGHRLEGRLLEMFNIIYLGLTPSYTDFRKLKHA